jgi:hypothetical protein
LDTTLGRISIPNLPNRKSWWQQWATRNDVLLYFCLVR